jgi:hypothetical protein
MRASYIFTVQRIRCKLKPKYQRTWIVSRNVAGKKYGNGIRDRVYPAALGNSKMGQSRKVYSLT